MCKRCIPPKMHTFLWINKSQSITSQILPSKRRCLLYFRPWPNYLEHILLNFSYPMPRNGRLFLLWLPTPSQGKYTFEKIAYVKTLQKEHEDINWLNPQITMIAAGLTRMEGKSRYSDVKFGVEIYIWVFWRV
ncbi:unnamed protein product [Blepharisma stoltei]|uniref:Uncharacterized protein n=1 Tax=Blepharisma stoltei TaxID=1481888 RepID=A0AAU9JPY8_9CILI|nr:unnamed protein product [Blepharisma stoltei]